MEKVKDNAIAEKYRAQGNEAYKKILMYDALTFYNKSLCCAEIDSSSSSSALGLAYANRSAVYVEMKLYEKALKNIHLAMEHNYPNEKMKSLMQRKDRCKKFMMEDVIEPQKLDPTTFFKLSYPANKRYPFIVDCLELRWDEKFGRQVISNKALNIGDVIAIDEPFYKVLQPHSTYATGCYSENICYQFCAFCMKSNCLNLIPCAGCSKSKF
jgi:tetratricopeptide (TPR) repeat protein